MVELSHYFYCSYLAVVAGSFAVGCLESAKIEVDVIDHSHLLYATALTAAAEKLGRLVDSESYLAKCLKAPKL